MILQQQMNAKDAAQAVGYVVLRNLAESTNGTLVNPFVKNWQLSFQAKLNILAGSINFVRFR